MAQTGSHCPALLLASASPRRRELLAQLGVSFTVAPADIDEQVMPEEAPEAYVCRMAVSKALAGLARVAAATEARQPIVLGADTTVVIDKQILGKPHDQEDALRMLALLSGRTHHVMSSVAVTDGERTETRTSITTVSFRDIRSGESAAYWASGEPCDKAGAYAVQGYGAVFVKELQGSYTGVVGLPLYETAELLAMFGCRLGLEPG